jgi:AcrR family transcriptional regulator
MKVSKTRELLICVAREIFVERGFHDTTMNDIAAASKKGRRTLYTYFKNKEDIYVAVVEKELSQAIMKLKAVVDRDINPERKLIEYIFTRLDTIKELVFRNGSLKGNFFSNVHEVEKARRKIDIEEISLIKRILQEGIDKGAFYVENLEITAMMIQFALRGVEIPYIKDNIRNKLRNNKQDIIQFLLRALKNK